jgi:hypothetical protein
MVSRFPRVRRTDSVAYLAHLERQRALLKAHAAFLRARYAGAVVTAFGARAHATGSRQKKEHNDRRPASEREYY